MLAAATPPPPFQGFEIRSKKSRVQSQVSSFDDMDLTQDTELLKFDGEITFATAFNGINGDTFTGMQKIHYNGTNLVYTDM